MLKSDHCSMASTVYKNYLIDPQLFIVISKSGFSISGSFLTFFFSPSVYLWGDTSSVFFFSSRPDIESTGFLAAWDPATDEVSLLVVVALGLAFPPSYLLFIFLFSFSSSASSLHLNLKKVVYWLFLSLSCFFIWFIFWSWTFFLDSLPWEMPTKVGYILLWKSKYGSNSRIIAISYPYYPSSRSSIYFRDC